MTRYFKRIILLAAIVSFMIFAPLIVNRDNAAAEYLQSTSDDDEDHQDEEHDDHDDHEEENVVILSPAQRNEAGIYDGELAPQAIAVTISVPGEVTENEYMASVITPRIPSIVTDRHVILGDQLTTGQPLVTMFSLDMSESQGNYVVAHREWERVQRLGRSVVSDKRLIEAEVALNQARTRLQAFGVNEAQLKSLERNLGSGSPGEYQLVSGQNGTIATEEFRIGELVEPGHVLFEIINEQTMWVEARVSPKQASTIHEEDVAWIRSGDDILKGVVKRQHRKLDQHTRTLGIRIEVPNPDGQLKPGQFVDVEIAGDPGPPDLALPSTAVLRSPDGDWMVFIEDDNGDLIPTEVELIRTSGDMAVIGGIGAYTRVVMEGAFFVQSQLAKGGFDPHNH